jgi:hypothetical protein
MGSAVLRFFLLFVVVFFISKRPAVKSIEKTRFKRVTSALKISDYGIFKNTTCTAAGAE